jgi:hypothetical protein
MRLSVLFTAALMVGANVALPLGSQVGEPTTLLEVDFESMNATSVFAGDGSAMRAEGTPPLIFCELKNHYQWHCSGDTLPSTGISGFTNWCKGYLMPYGG